jgi:predicted unusual protein kinase regulating ubiquinone biosynthesis (AarF/ABC1/UbiB family)
MLLAPRYLPRLTATIGLFTRYGLADFAKQQGLRSISPDLFEEGDDANGNGNGASATSPERAIAFRNRLIELGPTYIKLGQVLSTRPDLLPRSYIEELERLQDDVGPTPIEDIERTIEEELGGRISKLFETFEREPIGTASLGQVHAAELRDGRPVVVKIQRPNIRGVLADDLDFFRELARFLTDHTDAGARVDMLGIIQQLERVLSDELDYRIEARNAATLRRTLAEFPRLLIPRVIEAYTTQRVLTTDRVRGVKIAEVSPLTRLDHDFEPLADELTRAYLKQITIDGHFHADPHPGNVFVVLPSADNPATPSEVKAFERRERPRPALTPLSRIESQALHDAAPQPDDIDVRLALIDFGMTARLSVTLRDQITRLLLALADNRGDDAAEVLVEIGDPLPAFDRTAFVREISALMARNYDLSVGELDAGKLLYELINISFQRRLRLPGELTLLAKTLFNLDAVTRALQPSYTPIPTMREFASQIMAESAKRALNPRRLFQLATQGSSLLMSLPHRMDIITERLAGNEFEVKLNTPAVSLLTEALQKVANRVFSGTVLAGLLIASAMLLPTRRTLGTVGFVLSGALGFYMVLSILWSDRDRD